MTATIDIQRSEKCPTVTGEPPSERTLVNDRWAESGKIILCIITMSAFLVSSAAALGVGIAFHRIDLALGVMSAVSGWVTCVEGALLLLYM